jgi:type I restriction enzyme R subunit
MNEAETRAELIDPALRAAGWGIVAGSRIRREVIAPGRLVGNGRRGKSDIADYVLVYRGHKLAVIEAKKRDAPDTEGVGQAKKYAKKLDTRFAYSTNGIGLYQIDMRTGVEGYISTYPSPDELWNATYSEENVWRDRFADVPFEDKSGTFEARYYQHNAIQHVLEAIGEGETESCSPWPPAPAKPSSPFNWPGNCSKAAGTSAANPPSPPHPVPSGSQHPRQSSPQRLFRLP